MAADDRRIALPIDGGKVEPREGFTGPYLLLDPALLPDLCVRCSGPGDVEQVLQFAEPVPRAFWLTLGLVFLVAPLLFGLGAAVVALVWGVDALGAFAAKGAGMLSVLATGAGLYSARVSVSRSQWGVAYRHCGPCAAEYRGALRWFTAAAVLAGGAFLFWPMLSLMFLYEPPKPSLAVALILGSFPALLALSVLAWRRLRRARALKADLVGTSVVVEFDSLQAAAAVRGRLAA